MYAVSKTALLGLTKGLAAELGPEGITVNCVAPGIVPTKFSAALVADPELVRGHCCAGLRRHGPGVSLCRARLAALTRCVFSFVFLPACLQERMQIESTNLKRLGTPQDIAGAVAFLSSPDASYVTGETLVVAGGMQSRL